LYSIKEIYKTIQGEGAFSGRPAVFCRFSGCNLWTGREEDRANAICQFCDTDFIGTNGENGGKYAAAELAEQLDQVWRQSCTDTENKFVVFTGGEPLLQLNEGLIEAVKEIGFYIAVETNGTCDAPDGIDWICMSPKAGAELKLKTGNELKLVYPQPTLLPHDIVGLEFDRYFLQPMDGPKAEENTKLATQYCLNNPRWELSLQMHKLLGIP
jgi:7-carboxy-7-deazaguanine synthase (Cx14CxxC type)